MTDAPWFRHDADASADPKLEALAMEYGFAGIGRWWNLVEFLRTQTDYRLELTEWTPSILAKRWTTPREPCSPEEAKCLLDAMVDRFNLIKRSDGYIWSDSLLYRMLTWQAICDHQRAAGLASAAARRQRNGTAQPRRKSPNPRTSSNRFDKPPNDVREISEGGSEPVRDLPNEGLEGLERLERGEGTGGESAASAAALTAAPCGSDLRATMKADATRGVRWAQEWLREHPEPTPADPDDWDATAPVPRDSNAGVARE